MYDFLQLKVFLMALLFINHIHASITEQNKIHFHIKIAKHKIITCRNIKYHHSIRIKGNESHSLVHFSRGLTLGYLFVLNKDQRFICS